MAGSTAPLFLRTELLRPGDVILERGVEKHSRVLQLAGNHFTHAAIAVAQHIVVESTEMGTGPTWFELEKVERWPDGSARYLTPIRGEETVVLRHPMLESENDLRLSDRLMRTSGAYWYKEYPELKELSKASSDKVWVRWVAGQLLSFADRVLGRQPELPGLVCSALVAQVLMDLKLEPPPFEPGRLAESVRPDDLGRTSLVEQRGLVVEADPGLPDDASLRTALNSHIDHFGRRGNLLDQLELGRTAERTTKMIAELERSAQRARDQAALILKAARG